jgi:hypothetical protein
MEVTVIFGRLRSILELQVKAARARKLLPWMSKIVDYLIDNRYVIMLS